MDVCFQSSAMKYDMIVCPTAHSGCVRGVAIDAVNMEVFSGSADKTIKV